MSSRLLFVILIPFYGADITTFPFGVLDTNRSITLVTLFGILLSAGMLNYYANSFNENLYNVLALLVVINLFIACWN